MKIRLGELKAVYSSDFLCENTMATNFEPHECVISFQSTKIGTHENKAIHSIFFPTIVRRNVDQNIFHR